MGTLDPAWRNAIAAALLAAAAIGVAYVRGSSARPPAPSPATAAGEHTVDVRLRRIEEAGATDRVTEVSLGGDLVGDTSDDQVWERLRRVLRAEAAGARNELGRDVDLRARVATSLARRVPPETMTRVKALLRETGFVRIGYAPLGGGVRPLAAVAGPRSVVPVQLARTPHAGLEVVVDGLRAGTAADEETWSEVGRLARAARRRREKETAGGARVVFEIRGDDRVTTRDFADAAEALHAAGITAVLYAER
jgi:hypothetical protein